MFVSVPEGVRPAPSSEGHVYTGKIAQGRWVDAGNLVAGYKLLGEDASWSVVVSVEITDTPLEAYNLTVEDFHTYFVKAGTGAGLDAVWVHNNCGPNLNDSVSQRHLDKSNEILNQPNRVGTTTDVGDGSVSIDGRPGNDHEVQIAVEIAEATGKNVRVKGDGRNGETGEPNPDLEIDGQPFEVKEVNKGRLNTVTNAFDEAIKQAPNVLLDGRAAKLSRGTALDALRTITSRADFDASAAITIYTSGGRVRFVPGQGILNN